MFPLIVFTINSLINSCDHKLTRIVRNDNQTEFTDSESQVFAKRLTSPRGQEM